MLPAYGSNGAQVILVDRREITHKWYRLSVDTVSNQVDVAKLSLVSSLVIPVGLSQPEYRQISTSTSSAVIYSNSTSALSYYKLSWDGTSLSYDNYSIPNSAYVHEGYDNNANPVVKNGNTRKIYDITNRSFINLSSNHQTKRISRPDLLSKVYPFEWLSGDYNGDGLTDIGIFHLKEPKWYFALSDGVSPDIIHKVKNGIGGSYSFEYTNSTKFDHTGGR